MIGSRIVAKTGPECRIFWLNLLWTNYGHYRLSHPMCSLIFIITWILHKGYLWIALHSKNHNYAKSAIQKHPHALCNFILFPPNLNLIPRTMCPLLWTGSWQTGSSTTDCWGKNRKHTFPPASFTTLAWLWRSDKRFEAHWVTATCNVGTIYSLGTVLRRGRKGAFMLVIISSWEGYNRALWEVKTHPWGALKHGDQKPSMLRCERDESRLRPSL